MFYYAVFSDEQPNENALKIIGRVCSVLSNKAILNVVPDAGLGNEALRKHNGLKYSYFPCYDDTGIRINLNPYKGNLNKIAYTHIPAYTQLNKEDRDVAMSALAALHSYDGNESKKAKFLVTFKESNQDSFIPLKIARKLGTKVFNLSNNDEAVALLRLAKALHEQ